MTRKEPLLLAFNFLLLSLIFFCTGCEKETLAMDCSLRSDGNQATLFDSEDTSPPSISFRAIIIDVLDPTLPQRSVTGVRAITIQADISESVFGSFFIQDNESGVKSINVSSFTDYTCEDTINGQTFEVVTGPNLLLSSFANFSAQPSDCVQATDTIAFSNFNERYSECRETEIPMGVYSFRCQAVNWNNDTSQLEVAFDITD